MATTRMFPPMPEGAGIEEVTRRAAVRIGELWPGSAEAEVEAAARRVVAQAVEANPGARPRQLWELVEPWLGRKYAQGREQERAAEAAEQQKRTETGAEGLLMVNRTLTSDAEVSSGIPRWQ
jgi:hypothetical protein